MTIKEKYKSDIAFILSKKQHLDGDFWTTDDNRIGKGSPFSARDVAILLTELGFTSGDPEIEGLAATLFKAWRPDGRFKIAPSGTMYPCYTITILRALCYLGYVRDERLTTTFNYLLDIQHTDGGWRCNRAKMGKKPDMDLSNPGVTLEALDAFRFTDHLNANEKLDDAVETLLQHWVIRRPLGPCHFGIGTLFMQTEFPFLRYNLFYYCYVLSFYDKAKNDTRFLEAIAALDEKVINGKLVIQNPNRGLAKLGFCKKGEPSEIATTRYQALKSRLPTKN